MTTLFISDLHLDASRPDITRAFERFMHLKAPQADQLYILGDFFEVWVGDDDHSEFNQHIIKLLHNYSTSGKSLSMMVGNRDFLLGREFARQSGAQMLNDPKVIDLYGTPTLLMHGDSLCTKDKDYMAFRQQARSPAWQQQLLDQSLEARHAIARQLREQSQNSNKMKAEDIMDVTLAEVIREMQAAKVTRIIHGHTHRPQRHSIALDDTNQATGERIVLGDWDKQLWWLQAEADGSLELQQRTINATTL